MELLIVMPTDFQSEHSQRAWQVAMELVNLPEVDARMIVGDRGEIGNPDAAVVFNAPGKDVQVLVSLKADRKPTMYCMGAGPVDSEGVFMDENVRSVDFALDRRSKMWMATVVQADSRPQANAAEVHFGVKPRWLINPPAPLSIPKPPERRKLKEVVVVGRSFEDWDPNDWADDHGAKAAFFDDEFPAINHATSRGDCIVCWFKPPYYGERLLTVAASGVPLVARSCALFHEELQAEWFTPVRMPSGALSFSEPVNEALDRVLHWDETRRANMVASACQSTWEQWAKNALEALQCAGQS